MGIAPRTPAGLSQALLELGGPAYVRAMLDDVELDFWLELTDARITKALSKRKDRKTRLDVLRAEIAECDGGGHSAEWVEAMLTDELGRKARQVAKRPEIGRDLGLACAIVNRAMLSWA